MLEPLKHLAIGLGLRVNQRLISMCKVKSRGLLSIKDLFMLVIIRSISWLDGKSMQTSH